MKKVSQLEKVAAELFSADSAERIRFCDAIAQGSGARPALIWLSPRPAAVPFAEEAPDLPIPLAEFVSIVSAGASPGKTDLHQQGYFYCLDLSSVVAASIVDEIGPLETVIDLCAAPGGKAIYCWRRHRPGLIVCNEVIGKRTAQLISNLKRCAVRPSVVTSLDSSQLAELAPRSADLVIVDAPCSGQSLLVKGEESPGCFHFAAINMNSNRQRRIIANGAKLVRAGGCLAYMTCTYSRKENEGVIEWFLKKHPEFSAVEIPRLTPLRSALTDQPVYRVLPGRGFGVGGFAALLRYGGGDRGEFKIPERFFRFQLG